MRKGKQRIAILKNPVYCRLISEIAKGNNYAQKIAEVLKDKEDSVISRQLEVLEQEGFAKSERIEDKSVWPMKRLKIYQLNYSPILKFVEDMIVEYIFGKMKDKVRNDIRVKKEIEEIHKNTFFLFAIMVATKNPTYKILQTQYEEQLDIFLGDSEGFIEVIETYLKGKFLEDYKKDFRRFNDSIIKLQEIKKKYDKETLTGVGYAIQGLVEEVKGLSNEQFLPESMKNGFKGKKSEEIIIKKLENTDKNIQSTKETKQLKHSK